MYMVTTTTKAIACGTDQDDKKRINEQNDRSRPTHQYNPFHGSAKSLQRLRPRPTSEHLANSQSLGAFQSFHGRHGGDTVHSFLAI